MVQPYLFYEGRCEEAIEFYRKALDAKVDMMMRYDDNPEPPPESMIPPGNGHKIMHAALNVAGSIFMLSDGLCSGKTGFQGFSLSVQAADEAEARRRFDALADGGKVNMPLAPSFFSPAFGMLTDRFGVGWMVVVPQAM
jgi:PhnB protein